MVSPSLAEMQMALDPALPGLALDPALPGLALDPALPGLALDPAPLGLALDPALPGLALDPAPLGLAPSWSASPQAQEAARRLEHEGALVEEVMQLRDALAAARAEIAKLKGTPRACKTPGCERLAAEAETLDNLPPGDAARGDRVNRRTQLEAQGLCFACADQIAQGPPLGEHVWMVDVCARCGARVSLANNTPCAWRPRSLEVLTTRGAASELADRAKAWVNGDPTEPTLTAHGGVCVEDQTLRSPDQLDNLVARLLHLRGQMSWSAPEDAENARATADPDLTAHGYVSVPEQSLRSPDRLDKLVSLLLQLRGRMSWPAPEDEGGA